MLNMLAALKTRRGPSQRAGLAADGPPPLGLRPTPRVALASAALPIIVYDPPCGTIDFGTGAVADGWSGRPAPRVAQSATRFVHSASMSLPVLADHGSAGAL
jgi:hypothetical protein